MAHRKPSAPLASPDEIEQQFYEALQRGDLDRLMAVWSDDEEISCVHPGGPRVVGATAIRSAFESIFANGAVNAQPEKVRRLQTHACSVHSVLERLSNLPPIARTPAAASALLPTAWAALVENEPALAAFVTRIHPFAVASATVRA